MMSLNLFNKYRTELIINMLCYVTECTKIYRKSVLHLLKYRFAVYLSRCSTDLHYILGHSVNGYLGYGI